ncbi:MAG: HD-GYP domain-containing protein [Ignavibacteriales bacterium]
MIVKAYVVSVATSSVAFFLLVLKPTIHGVPDAATAAGLMVVMSVAEVWAIRLSERNLVSVAPAFHSAGYIMFEPGTAALMAAICSVIADSVGRRPIHKTVFNAAQYVLCIGVAGIVYRSEALSYPRGSLLADLPVFALSAVVSYIINVSLVCLALLLAESRGMFRRLFSQAQVYLVEYLSLSALGMLLSFVYRLDPDGLVLLLLPIGFAYQSMKRYADLQTETRQAMEALADSIDRRDDFTFDHSLRVAGYSARTAREMNLPEGTIDEIYLAARIHDLGKVGLTNKVLFKKGHLSEFEWERIREHPQIGEQIAGKLKFYRRCTTILRHHHENYDGSGYPDGLAGNNIPIGARVIRVTDAFDAMATDRPYRKALPREVAIAEIRKGSGALFCPEVVDAFLRVIARQDSTGAGGG